MMTGISKATQAAMLTIRADVPVALIAISSHGLLRKIPQDAASSRSLDREHLRVDAIRRMFAGKEGEDVVGDQMRHLLAHLADRAAEMRRQDHVTQLAKILADFRLVFKDVQASAGDLPRGQRLSKCGLIDNRATRRIDQIGGLLHQFYFPGADLMPRTRI